MQALLSRDMLDEAYTPAGTRNPAPPIQGPRYLNTKKLLAGLARRLEAPVVRKSNVLTAIAAPTPEQAQEMQRLIAAFIARQRQISRPPARHASLPKRPSATRKNGQAQWPWQSSRTSKIW